MVEVTSQLPYELWHQIIRQIPGQDRRRCLSVSRIVHDVAIPLIFSRIVIFFGTWDSVNDPVQLAYGDADSQDDDENDNGPVAPQRHTSIELLRYIAHAPHFAEVVKKMTVAAFSSANAQEEESSQSSPSSLSESTTHCATQNVWLTRFLTSATYRPSHTMAALRSSA